MKILNSKLKNIGILLLIALGFYFFTRGDSGPKDTIDLKLGVIKAPDIVGTVQIANKEMVQVRFSWEAGGITYNDALNITKEEYAKLKPEDIERMKEERFQAWVKTVNEGSKR